MQSFPEKNTIATIIFPKDQRKNTGLTEIVDDLGPTTIPDSRKTFSFIHIFMKWG